MGETEAEKDEIMPEEIPSNVILGKQNVVVRSAFQTHRANHEKSADELESIFNMINVHMDELDVVGNILAKTAQKLTLRASWVKVLVIVLGASVATREVANQLVGASSALNIVIYTIIGLLIAALTGLEAAFKWENKSAELRMSAATCRVTRRQSTSQLTEVFTIETDQGKLVAVKKLLDSLDVKLGEIQERIATLGVNIVLEIQTRYKVTSGDEKNR